MACTADPATCRREHIAGPLQLKPNPRRPGDWEGRCPECGHGGFALSQPTLTKMRNMWSCNCKICNGGKGCTSRAIRGAMIRKKIRPWCLGSYIGKDEPEADLDRLRKIAQTVDDLINCCPALSAADMVMLLADARGDRIPGEYSECAAFARKLGMSNGNAYNVARRWTAGSGSRPSDSEVPPQTGGGSQGLQSYHTAAEPRQTPRSEARNLPKVGNGDSKSWKETGSDEPPGVPKIGKRTLGNNKNRRPAA